MANKINIVEYLHAGIRAAAMRQKAIANNIANLNTPNYRRFEIKFDDALRKAMEKGQSPQEAKLEPEFFQPKNTTVKSNGNDVIMDVEVGEMVKNGLRHQALTLLLKKKYDGMKAIIDSR